MCVGVNLWQFNLWKPLLQDYNICYMYMFIIFCYKETKITISKQSMSLHCKTAHIYTCIDSEDSQIYMMCKFRYKLHKITQI